MRKEGREERWRCATKERKEERGDERERGGDEEEEARRD